MDEKQVQTIIEKNIVYMLKCGEPLEVKETSDRHNQHYWNYLLSTNELGTIGSIDFVPAEKKIQVNMYDNLAITISENYRQNLEEELNNAISDL